MNRIAQRSKEFLLSESGPTTVEYAVMITLIIAVCILSIRMLGFSVRDIFFLVFNSLTDVEVDNGM